MSICASSSLDRLGAHAGDEGVVAVLVERSWS
jgi:tRNA threonylcarbamoyladenosine modification (KEOPS) complex Cgi121 subunit